MAILNVTPDSFYDGGKFQDVDKATQQAMRMIEEGADIIDIGGESTGPGSKEVSREEEVRRVMPIVKAVSGKRLAVRISIDTYKIEVAKQTLEAGATIVNDVTAGRADDAMFRLIAETGCFYIMMRSKDSTPRTTKSSVQYSDITKEIHAFFEERIAAAMKAGVQREQLILDPGLGHFVSSDPHYSWEILERLEELQDFGCPILVSPSRKSFTASFPGEPPEKRLPETLRATKIALEHGARIIRTHDVVETKEVIDEFFAFRIR